METFNKIEVLPVSKEKDGIKNITQNRKRNSRINLETKIDKILKIILNLAKIKAYNESGNIIGEYGPIEGTSVVEILNLCMQNKREVLGINEFLDLLVKSKTSPDLILNKYIREKLIEKISEKNKINKLNSKNVKIILLIMVGISHRKEFDKVLNSIYYDVNNPASYSGVNKLYQYARKKIPNLSISYVKNWLSGQNTYTLHKPVKKNLRDEK